jgi:hypothetical protein
MLDRITGFVNLWYFFAEEFPGLRSETWATRSSYKHPKLIQTLEVTTGTLEN